MKYKNYIPSMQINSIFDLSPDFFADKGILGLLIDIDNTLVPMHVKNPDKNVFEWVKLMKSKGIKLCLYSNASKKRVDQFNKELKIFAIHRAYKPNIRSMKKASLILGLSFDKMAIAGDQIFTDIKAGNLAGIYSILVKPIDTKEILFVRFKRIFERKLLKKINDIKG